MASLLTHARARCGHSAAAVFLLALAWLTLTGGLWTRIPLMGDPAIFVEYAIRVADGQVPHLDFEEVKPTGFAFVALPFLKLGRLLGVADWTSARFCSLTMVALLAAAIFAAVRSLFAPSRGADAAARAGWLSALGLIALRGLPEAIATGLEPKLFTLLCPIAAVALVLNGRPLTAGLIAAFTPFHWQPGALLWVAPLALAWRRPAAERALVRYLVGSALTVAICAAYLIASGSLAAFVDQTLVGAFGSVGSEERGSSMRLSRIALLTWAVAGWELVVCAPWLVLMATGCRLALWPIAAPVLIFGAWSLLDFQGMQDLVVLVLPLLALAGAELGLRAPARAALPLGVVLLAASCLPHRIESEVSLARQREAAADYLAAVQNSAAPVFALGDLEVPLLAERPTLGRELVNYGLYERLERDHPGGAVAWLRERLAEQPGGVVIGRSTDPRLAELLRVQLEAGGWRLLEEVERVRSTTGREMASEIWVRGG